MSPSYSLLAVASLVLCLPVTNGLAIATNDSYLEYAAAVYSLKDTYNAGNFFSSFSLFSGADPTGGFVNYQGSLSSAQSAGLVNTNNNQVYMGVDHTSTLSTSSAGRPSIRVSSNKAYTHGLFIADIAHMPGSICGSVSSAGLGVRNGRLMNMQNVARLLACWTKLARRRRN